MNELRRFALEIFQFYIFSNFHVALCAAAICAFTCQYFGNSPNPTFLAFVACATLCSYNAHWFLSSSDDSNHYRMQWLVKNRHKLLIISVIGGVGALYFFLFFQKNYIEITFIAFVTFFYTAPKIPIRPFVYLKKYAVAKTFYLAFAWTFVSYYLPFKISNSQFKNGTIQYFIPTLYFFYFLQICMLFDYKDRKSDARAKLKNWITYLKPSHFKLLFYSLAILMLIGLYLIPPFSIKSNYILAICQILLLLQMPFALRTSNDYYYYFVLDAMIMLPWLLNATF